MLLLSITFAFLQPGVLNTIQEETGEKEKAKKGAEDDGKKKGEDKEKDENSNEASADKAEAVTTEESNKGSSTPTPPEQQQNRGETARSVRSRIQEPIVEVGAEGLLRCIVLRTVFVS